MEFDERKIKEIEHSRKRRSILQGSERHSDTSNSEKEKHLEALVRDQDEFEYHFSNMKFYSITRKSEQFQYNWLKEKCKNRIKVLDFACGNGENGIYAAKCGAEVIGIDISPEGIENANKNAKREGVSKKCFFKVMDGENMTFKNNSFDLAVEYGALHHVELDITMAELRRVLKPNGEMICIEALRHNPFIHWYRKRTPHLRTEWEVNHILRVQDLDVIRKYFKTVNIRFFHLAALFAVPFRKTRIFVPLRNFLDKIDNILLKNQFLGKYAWIMIFTISKPNK